MASKISNTRKALFILAILIGIGSIVFYYKKDLGHALSGVCFSLAIILPSLIKNKYIAITVLIILLASMFTVSLFL